MVKLDKSDNTEFLEKSIHHLEATGFENIKADMEGYEKPKSYREKVRRKNYPRYCSDKKWKKIFF